MSDFTTAIDDNPGISQTANRNHSLGNLGTPGALLLRNRGAISGPPALRDHPCLSDDRRRHRRHHDLRPEPAGAVLADVDGRLAAQADGRPGVRSPLRRHALAAELADLQLQRGQHRRERLPERIPAGAANLQANIAAGRGNTFALHRCRRAQRRCRSSSRTSTGWRASQASTRPPTHGTQLDQRDIPGVPGGAQPQPVRHGHQ